MIRTVQLAVAVSLASLVAASAVPRNSFVTVPIVKRSVKVSAKDFVTREKARISSFSSAAVGEQPIINGLVSYYAPTIVGTQTFELIVDTGSSNTWVGADTKYVKSTTGTSTGKSVSVSYGSGSFSGTEYTDTVTLGGLTVAKQSIGVASTSTGFDGTDGILGVGPVILTQGTVSGTTSVPTFLDNLYSQGSITIEALGVYFAPESGSDTDDENGELTLGGVDTSKYTGTLTYVAKSTVSPYSYYWGIAVASIKYGTTSLSTSANAIVDTGTTLIYIPSAAYTKFLTASGGKNDASSGLAIYSTKPTGSVTFTIGAVGYVLTPAQYLVPTAEYSLFGLTTGKYYAWINDGGASAADVNFIIGQKFLENYYSVYDTTNSRLGFATRA